MSGSTSRGAAIATPPGARVDRVATAASFACAIHCALAPLLLPLLPLVLGTVLDSGVDWTFFAISAVLGLWSLGHSYRALHARRLPLVLFTMGIAVLAWSNVRAIGNVAEIGSSLTGAAFIMAAHVLNLRLRRVVAVAGTCACPCHDADDHGPA